MENHRLTLAASAVFLILAAFLWTTQNVLSPLLIGGILVFLLMGMKESIMARRLIVGIVLILLVWFFVMAQAVVFMFVTAFVLAYLFDPIADWLEGKGIRRSLATFFLLFITLGLLVLFGSILIPSLVSEIQELISRIPGMANNVAVFVQSYLPKVLEFLRIDAAEFQDGLLEEVPKRTELVLSNLLKGVTGIGAFLSRIFNVILIPVLTFYFLKDFNRIRDWMLDMVPRKYRGNSYFYLWRLNRILGGYIRGQIIVSTIIGILTGLGLTLFRLPFAILLAFLTALLNVIPVIGLYLGLGIALLTGFFSPEPLLAMLKIGGVYLFVQALDGYVIAPKILGDRVGLHPLAVIFSVLVFARFLGFWGLIIGVPTAALIKFFVDEWRRRQKWREMLAQKSGIDNTESG